MRRRTFLNVLGGAAATLPSILRAQPGVPAVGFLSPSSPAAFTDRVLAFRQGLNQTGYVDGSNVTITFRWAEGRIERLPALADELLGRRVSVIAAAGLSAARAAKGATTTVPIVFFIGEDPVKLGLVASLRRPGGIITGVTTLNTEVGPKRLELLHELVPPSTALALLVNPTSPTAESLSSDMQAAARGLSRRLHMLHASSENDLEKVFASLHNLRPVALAVTTDAIYIRLIEKLAKLALHHNIPAIFQYRTFTAAGGLMSYGGDFADLFHQFGVYTGRILKGEKPADLPVQQAAKVELFINLKTAAALGITVPQQLLGRADGVIE
jgi:putative ABC transport system substrate-binding protein